MRIFLTISIISELSINAHRPPDNAIQLSHSQKNESWHKYDFLYYFENKQTSWNVNYYKQKHNKTALFESTASNQTQ